MGNINAVVGEFGEDPVVLAQMKSSTNALSAIERDADVEMEQFGSSGSHVQIGSP